MKNLLITLLFVSGVISMASAQEGGIAAGVSGRVFAPACTNCDALYGFGLAGSYAITEKIVGTADLGFYSKSEGGGKISAVAFGVSGDYYFKGLLKVFT